MTRPLDRLRVPKSRCTQVPIDSSGFLAFVGLNFEIAKIWNLAFAHQKSMVKKASFPVPMGSLSLGFVNWCVASLVRAACVAASFPDSA
jgi:hypothetical protein